MANYLKPQVPLRKDENYIYPLTSVDQIVTEKGRLINEIITVDLDTEYNGETKKLNADLLGGRPESDFLSINLTDAEKGEFYPIYAENGIYEYAHSAGSLTGQGVNGKFKATVNETVTNLNINGETFIVNCNGENSIELKNNCWYSFILDGEDKTINFKSGGGGGINLNYKIIGGLQQPTSPIENTIWINTNIEIGEYQFSSNQPINRSNGEALANGDIWIKTNNKSNISFNAFKENVLMIYPALCYQYNNSNWEIKSLTIYKNGEWKNMGIQLIANGQALIDFTATAYYPSEHAGSHAVSVKPSITQNSDYYQISQVYTTTDDDWGVGTVFTADTYNLSQYSTLSITCGITAHSESRAKIYISTTKTTNSYSHLKTLSLVEKTTADGTSKTYTLDISNLTADAYIGIMANIRGQCGTQYIRITDLRLY